MYGQTNTLEHPRKLGGIAHPGSKTMMKVKRSQTISRKIRRLSTLQQNRANMRSSKNLFETEDILSKIIQKPGWKFSLFLIGILYASAIAGAQTLFHTLAGHVPYSDWDCLGTPESNPKCFEATQNLNRETNSSIFNKTTICENNLKAGLHFLWNSSDVTYFATEWGLYCKKMGAVKDLVVQMFYAGSAVGTLIAWVLYDTVGRRTSALVGLMIAASASAISAFAPDAYILMIHRFLQGMALFIYYTAVYIYLMEIIPIKFRVVVSTLYMIFWSLGYFLEILVFVLADNWGTVMSTMALLLTLALIPLLFGPDSPRFKLVILRREEEARKELELLFGINDERFQFKEYRAALTFHEQRMDEITGLNILRLHPKFVKEILVLMVLWFVVGFSYYGFIYSFSELSDHIVRRSVYSAIGEVAANILAIIPLHFLGRKRSCQLFFLLAGASFIVTMFPFPTIKNIISVQDLSALLGNMGVTAAFTSLYLYTFELSPTTHRGRIFNTCQFICRLGSVAGARSHPLYELNRYFALITYSALNMACFALLFFMPVTKGTPTPNVPVEVERRRSTQLNNNSDKSESNSKRSSGGVQLSDLPTTSF